MKQGQILEAYESGEPRPSARQVMIDGVAAEIRGLVDAMTVDSYQDQLTEVIRVATWARGPMQTFDSIDDMLADLEEEDGDGPGL